jgi:hypothetical protein
MCKYVAKFVLLERGLLDAAQGVDDLHIKTQPPQPKSKSKSKAKGAKESDNDDVDVDVEAESNTKPSETRDETNEEFEARINLFVHVHLRHASSSKRDHYKHGLVYQARKQLITEFLKSTILKKCQNEDCCA